MLCPRCSENPLVEKRISKGVFWTCQKCDGRLVGLALLRKISAPDFLSEVWREAKQVGQTGCVCPSCQRAMSLVHPPHGYNLDICTACYSIWFDRGEVPPRLAHPTVGPQAESSQAVARVLAQAWIETHNEKKKWQKWARFCKTLMMAVRRW